MLITFLKNWKTYEAGTSADVDDETGELLIAGGKAEKATKSADELKKELEAGINEKIEKALESTFVNFAAKAKSINVITEPKKDWKSLGDYLGAVKNAAFGHFDPRLQKAAAGQNETTDADGKYLIQPEYVPGIMDKVRASSQIFPRCDVRNTSSNTVNYAYVNETSTTTTSGTYTARGGVVIYSVAEAGTITASKPAYAQLQLNLHKQAALLPVTEEMLEDMVASTDDVVDNLIGGAIADFMDWAVLRGTASTQMTGIIGNSTVATVTRATTGTIAAGDLFNMYSKMWPAGARNAAWVISPSVLPKLYGMSVSNTAVYVPSVGSFAGTPAGTLLGLPIIVSEHASSLGTAADVILADFSQYKIATKASGVRRDVSIHVYFSTDQSAFRFIFRADGKPWMPKYTGTGGDELSWAVSLS